MNYGFAGKHAANFWNNSRKIHTRHLESEKLTVLKRNSLARHISRLRITHTGSKKASYRDLVRTTGIPLSVLHAIAQGKSAIPGWIEKLAAAHNAEWRLVVPRRRRRRQP
jgi:hypothetical protein